jgi:tetratricopeptide (TPR) repeat protein
VTSRFSRTAGVTAIILVLLAGAVQLQAVREERYPPLASDDESLYLRSSDTLRRLAGAYTLSASDLYWIRAIQYYGGNKRRVEAEMKWPAPPPALAKVPDDYPLLYPLLDITTTLDPLFTVAYRFGSVFLAESEPRGAGRPDLAIALLEKGLRSRPDKWEYMQDIGFVHYWYMEDYKAAADWFNQASLVPGAPWWLKSLAATTLAQGGDRRSSRAMWEAILQSADNDWMRQDAERRLMQLRALDEIDLLQRRLDTYVARIGHPATSWEMLIRAGLVAGVPLDPTRTPYALSADGQVTVSQSSTIWPLPVEPRHLPTPPS